MTKIKLATEKKAWNLLIFTVPALLLVLTFSYIPMSGLIMAFKKDLDLSSYANPIISIIMAPWAGFDQFKILFTSELFTQALGNTLIISVLKIVLVFPIPIVLAIFVSELKSQSYSKVVQSIMYLPHFLSWAIVSTMFLSFMQVDGGALNTMLSVFGVKVNVSDPNQFRMIMVLTTAWKDVGWSAVTYIAAIMAIDQEQFEAAKIDGASKFQQIIHITLPSISAVIAVLLIMRIGYMMDAGFEQIFAMLTPTAEAKGEIIGTLIYKMSIKQGGSYEFTTAAGLFNSLISLVLIVGGNALCKKTFNRGII